MKKTLLNYMGLLGVVSLLSDTAAVLFAPMAYFGVPERFSVFAAAGFQAVLGIYLFRSGDRNRP